MEPPDYSPEEYYKIRRGRPRWILPVVIITIVIAAGLAAWWYVRSRPTVQVSEGEAALDEFPVSPEDEPVMNETRDYILPIPKTWELFEETSHTERSELTAPEILSLLETCGHECATVSVMKLGNFPSDGCDTDACREMAFSEGGALTIYAFPNPARLPIDDFLEQALGIAIEGSGIYFSKAEDGSDVRFEVLELPNGFAIQTHYLAKGDRVFRLAMDINISDQAEYERTYYAVRRAIGLLVLQ